MYFSITSKDESKHGTFMRQFKAKVKHILTLVQPKISAYRMENDVREPLARSEHFFILNINFETAGNIALLNNFGNIHSGVSC